MSEQKVQKVKSNAPWILGIIGVFLTVLHFACAVLCSAAAGFVVEEGKNSEATAGEVGVALGDALLGGKSIDGLAKQEERLKKEKAKNAAEGREVAEKGIKIATYSALIMLGCFILSFFGKSGISGITGFLLIIGGIAGGILSIVHLSIAGIAAGIVYMCSGISSICNRKKIKA